MREPQARFAPFALLLAALLVSASGRVEAQDLGVFYQGRPVVSMTADPKVPDSVPPRFYADLEAERARIEEDLKDYELYPVVSIGLTVRL